MITIATSYPPIIAKEKLTSTFYSDRMMFIPFKNDFLWIIILLTFKYFAPESHTLLGCNDRRDWTNSDFPTFLPPIIHITYVVDFSDRTSFVQTENLFRATSYGWTKVFKRYL